MVKLKFADNVRQRLGHFKQLHYIIHGDYLTAAVVHTISPIAHRAHRLGVLSVDKRGAYALKEGSVVSVVCTYAFSARTAKLLPFPFQYPHRLSSKDYSTAPKNCKGRKNVELYLQYERMYDIL